MTYRDMTFCMFNADCADADKCGRAWSPEVKARYDAFCERQKFEIPVAMFMDRPECHRPA